MTKIYSLYIDAYSPETMPMARLAEYMQSFAQMLGHEAGVHFAGLKPGSTRLAGRVDHEQVPKVRAALEALSRGDGPPEAVRALKTIDRLLADDNASGFVFEDENVSSKIVTFPGATRPRPVQYGPIKQDGTLDGLLVSVGGVDKTVHIRLQYGDERHSNIETDRETGRRLAKHLFEPVRVRGTGSWIREEDGAWTLRRFKVESFEVLGSEDLRDTVRALRETEGSDWGLQQDPLALLRSLRDEGGERH